LSMPDLPPELQREIFETAVRLNRRDAALKLRLSLIAHHVHSWVDSAFYESVDIDQNRSADKFLNLVDLKPHGFFATAVKTLLLDGLRAASAVRILSLCTGVQSFAVWNRSSFLDTTFLLHLSTLSLHRLSMPCAYLANVVTAAEPPTWLASLTHLDIAFHRELTTSDLEKSLKQLPCLTHVALYEPRNSTHAQVVCTSCPVLEVLVLLRPGSDDIPADAFDDSRIVLIEYPSDPVDDWEAAHFGLPCMWTRAERVVVERKRLAALQPIGEAESPVVENTESS